MFNDGKTAKTSKSYATGTSFRSKPCLTVNNCVPGMALRGGGGVRGTFFSPDSPLWPKNPTIVVTGRLWISALHAATNHRAKPGHRRNMLHSGPRKQKSDKKQTPARALEPLQVYLQYIFQQTLPTAKQTTHVKRHTYTYIYWYQYIGIKQNCTHKPNKIYGGSGH